MRPSPLAFMTAVALAGAASSADGADDPAASAPAATSPVDAMSPCAVSGPAFDDRRERLRTALPAGLVLIALTDEQRAALPDPLPNEVNARLRSIGARFGPLGADGSVSVKSMWRRDRRAAGRLHVGGELLDGSIGRFTATIDRNYGGKRYSSFVPGTLNFGATGCWRIKARAGRARATYVVLVRPPEPNEFAPYLP